MAPSPVIQGKINYSWHLLKTARQSLFRCFLICKVGATPVAPLECCRVDPYKGDPRIIFNQWAQTCPVQLELHTYVLVWLFTDQSEQLHKDQSEGAIPTNQESAIWTNQGPGRELHKSEPPACFQFPLSPVCKLVTGVKVFLFPLFNLGTPVGIRRVAANFGPQIPAKNSSWELLQDGIFGRKKQNGKRTWFIFLEWHPQVRGETFRSTCRELLPETVGSWGSCTSNSITKTAGSTRNPGGSERREVEGRSIIIVTAICLHQKVLIKHLIKPDLVPVFYFAFQIS